MPYPIDRKLVVGVSSNVLFDLSLEDKIFREEGVEKYKKYQIENIDKPLKTGRAFPFIRRFLAINNVYYSERPVEVVLLSKNSPETGIRIFNGIKEYGLDISRAAFTSGESPFRYIPSFNVSLFLSTNQNDVVNAIENEFPAGVVLPTEIKDNPEDKELRVAFDFDGVISDDESEKIYQESGQLEIFQKYESLNVGKPLNPGLLADFFKKLSFFQKLETKKKNQNSGYKKILKTAIITARNAPAHERVVNTLKSWKVDVDEMLLLGGIEKKRFLEAMKPHLYIDDQMGHLDQKIKDIPLVHIPFGIANRKDLENKYKKLQG